jgi:hypothetical protein
MAQQQLPHEAFAFTLSGHEYSTPNPIPGLAVMRMQEEVSRSFKREQPGLALYRDEKMTPEYEAFNSDFWETPSLLVSALLRSLSITPIGDAPPVMEAMASASYQELLAVVVFFGESTRGNSAEPGKSVVRSPKNNAASTSTKRRAAKK